MVIRQTGIIAGMIIKAEKIESQLENQMKLKGTSSHDLKK